MSRRVALVSGGARRVGRAIVERLAGAGFEVVLTYMSSEREAGELVEALRDGGGTAVAVRADLTRPVEAVEAIAGAVGESFGRLDVLVNNASIYEPDGLEQAGVEQARRMMAIHYEAPLLLCRRLAPLLRESGGQVVNMVDLLAERPWPRYLSYCASKAALMNLTLGLARELAPAVTVNGIAPGVVEWPEDYPPAEREKYLRRVPLGRAGRPQDVAELVHFLVTGGSYITGQIIRLDGGRSIT
jgi:pteridine reductase